MLNPKAISMEELYGGVDKLTMEWKDGLMGLTVRHAVQVSGREREEERERERESERERGSDREIGSDPVTCNV